MLRPEHLLKADLPPSQDRSVRIRLPCWTPASIGSSAAPRFDSHTNRGEYHCDSRLFELLDTSRPATARVGSLLPSSHLLSEEPAYYVPFSSQISLALLQLRSTRQIPNGTN